VASAPGEPTTERLMALAAQLLGRPDRPQVDRELLRETVMEARELWVLLYRAHHGEAPTASAS
jgi:hypothetical protein